MVPEMSLTQCIKANRFLACKGCPHAVPHAYKSTCGKWKPCKLVKGERVSCIAVRKGNDNGLR